MAVAFRRNTLLLLDDCLYALQASPHLTRSALHRCFQRHEISRLPDIERDKSAKQRFKRYSIGFFTSILYCLGSVDKRSFQTGLDVIQH